MIRRTVMIAALGLAAGGCTHLQTPSGDLQTLGREDLKNAQGHVIGYKEMTRDAGTGERLTQITLFLPRLSATGRIIGYEERVRGGSVLHDLYGKKVGGRFEDLRSRKNMTIVVVARDEHLAAVPAPSIDELIRIARLDK
ncbi:MAG TPA: hypothetical protein VFI86_00920 [Burkholderiales bacterium]|nr:hypothetical protein [Burkholderiales bacterium]